MKTNHTKKVSKPEQDYEKTWSAFDRITERMKREGSPLNSLSKEEIIQRLRKTREHIWEEKLAARP